MAIGTRRAFGGNRPGRLRSATLLLLSSLRMQAVLGAEDPESWPSFLEWRGTEEIPAFFNFDCLGLKRTFKWDLLHKVAWGAGQPAALPAWPSLEEAWSKEGAVGAGRLLREAEAECPMGVLLYLLLDLWISMDGHEQGLPGLVQEELYKETSFSKSAVDLARLCFLGESFQSLMARVAWYLVAFSRWRIFEAMYLSLPFIVPRWRVLKVQCQAQSQKPAPEQLVCCRSEEDSHVWPVLKEAVRTFISGLGPEKSEPAEIRINDLTNSLLGSSSDEEVERLLRDCPCGMLAMLQYQAYATISRYTQRFQDHALWIQEMLALLPIETYGDLTDWPLVQMFRLIEDIGVGSIIRYGQYSLKRKGRLADLSPEVVAALEPFGHSTEARRLVALLAPQPDLIPVMTQLHPEFPRATYSLLASLAVKRQSRPVYYTQLYGEKFDSVFELTVQWMHILGLTPLLVSVCCTEEAVKKCLAHGELVSCWSPGSSALVHKYVPAVMMAHLGISMVYFDLDQLFLRSPGSFFDAAHEKGEADTIWTHHLNGNCLCSGMFYMRATASTAEWLARYVHWLYLHPYEIEQRGINAMLLPNATVKVSFKPSLPKLELGVLDDQNMFVSTYPGWMGDFAQIVSMHFQYMPLDDKVALMVPALEELLAYTSIHGRPPEDPSILPLTSAALSRFILAAEPPRADCW